MTSPSAPDYAVPASSDAGRLECCSAGDLESLKARTWDAVVIGAGPAGGASALILARRGWRVLLLERSTWPRAKTCGGCLSGSAIACLKTLNLQSILRQAAPIDRSILQYGRRHATIPTPGHRAMPRQEFDAAIVHAFLRAGGQFLPGASVKLETSTSPSQTRSARVRCDGEEAVMRARLILACDGLHGTSLDDEPWSQRIIARDAYLGVSTMLPESDFSIAAGEVRMHVGRGGYVGAVRYGESAAVHLAAALDPEVCRQMGGPAPLMEAILKSCNTPADLHDATLHGAPLLTRHRAQLGGQRVLAVGDACGYVEPFTGEGIAWALQSAIEVADLLPDEWSDDLPNRWRQRHREVLGRSQTVCRLVRWGLRERFCTEAALMILHRAPWLATPLISARKVGR